MKSPAKHNYCLNNEEGKYFENNIDETIFKSTECDTKSKDNNQEVSLYF